MDDLSILMAQINPKVGAIADNAAKIIDIICTHQDKHDLIVFPELVLSGYPPEDLLLQKEFFHRIDFHLDKIAKNTKNCHVIVGHPQWENGLRYNAASVFFQGKCVAVYHKQHLPNYGIFDELRYFARGTAKTCILEIKKHKIGLCICEDLWQPGPVEDLKKSGADTLICINASPFDYEKYPLREALLKKHALSGLAVIYVNLIGGQDELLFDGQSMALNHKGELCARAPAFKECLETVHIKANEVSGAITPLQDRYELIYHGLVCGTKDYIEKNNFPGVLLGLSGGIDSAVTLAIAVEAIGAEKVQAVTMPSRFTAEISKIDAMHQIKALNVAHSNLSIEPAFKSFLETLAPEFKNLPADTTEENIQARIRGVLLMALSNKTGKLVLVTSNKSETAVGYSTLYGDMAGGFAVLKDVLKTQVYELAHYINRDREIIPHRVFTRPPTAELAENQRDQDSLPEYAVLDAIITDFMNNLSKKEIIQRGHSPETVKRVIHLIIGNEFKRRQAAVGIKVSPRAFGRDWRFPITSGVV